MPLPLAALAVGALRTVGGAAVKAAGTSTGQAVLKQAAVHTAMNAFSAGAGPAQAQTANPALQPQQFRPEYGFQAARGADGV